MTSTNAVTSASTGATTSSAVGGVQESQDRFLKLLVTQMKNQDPLNPLDNAQVTSQMAQLSTVSGIEKLNASMQTMATSFAANQSLQASSMIGRSVLAPGSSMVLQDGVAIGGFELSQSVDHAIVTIKGSAGNVLHTVDMGAQSAGDVMFHWDGMTGSGVNAGNGTYKFEVSASLGGKKAEAVNLALGKVGSVSLGTTGVTLNTDVLGSLDVTKVKQVF